MAPLLPETHPDAAANPHVQVEELVDLLSQTKVTYPTADISPQFGQALLHRDSPSATGDLFDAVLEGFQFLRLDFDRHTFAYELKAKVLGTLACSNRPSIGFLYVASQI